jgi:hypothetical protein
MITRAEIDLYNYAERGPQEVKVTYTWTVAEACEAPQYRSTDRLRVETCGIELKMNDDAALAMAEAIILAVKTRRRELSEYSPVARVEEDANHE